MDIAKEPIRPKLVVETRTIVQVKGVTQERVTQPTDVIEEVRGQIFIAAMISGQPRDLILQLYDSGQQDQNI